MHGGYNVLANETLFWDQKAITDALGRWCRIVDTKSLDHMPLVFADSIEWDFGKGTVDVGLAKVIERIRAHLIRDSNCGATQHHLANLRVDLDGDTAESEAYFFATHAGVGPYSGQVLLQWGNYNDFWHRTVSGWRIVKRIYRIDISQGPLEIVYGSAPPEMWKEGDERSLQRPSSPRPKS